MKTPETNTLAHRLLRCAPHAARELARLQEPQARAVLLEMYDWVVRENVREKPSAGKRLMENEHV